VTQTRADERRCVKLAKRPARSSAARGASGDHHLAIANLATRALDDEHAVITVLPTRTSVASETTPIPRAALDAGRSLHLRRRTG